MALEAYTICALQLPVLHHLQLNTTPLAAVRVLGLYSNVQTRQVATTTMEMQDSQIHAHMHSVQIAQLGFTMVTAMELRALDGVRLAQTVQTTRSTLVLGEL